MRAGSTGTDQRSEPVLACLRSAARNTLRGSPRHVYRRWQPGGRTADARICDARDKGTRQTAGGRLPVDGRIFPRCWVRSDGQRPEDTVDRCTAGIRLSAVLHAAVMSLDGAANFGTRKLYRPMWSQPCRSRGSRAKVREGSGLHRRGRGVSPAARPRRAHDGHPLVAGRAPA